MTYGSLTYMIFLTIGKIVMAKNKQYGIPIQENVVFVVSEMEHFRSDD